MSSQLAKPSLSATNDSPDSSLTAKPTYTTTILGILIQR
jgi:hypothetical protein